MSIVMKTISDLGHIITGNTPPRKKPEYYGDAYPFIKPTDIEIDSRYTLNPAECYSELGYQKYLTSMIPKNSTCVVTIGSIGKKITMAHTDCFINQAMNAIVPYPQFNAAYVFYLMKNNLSSVKSSDSGTSSGRENVSKSAFSSIEILVETDIRMQGRIASILSAYDDLIENNLQRMKLLEDALKCEYRLLSNQSEGCENKLTDYVDFVKGVEPGAKNYHTRNTEDLLPFIRVGDLSKMDYNTFIEAKYSNEVIAKGEDVLISLDATIGLVRSGLTGCYSTGIRKVQSKGTLSQPFIYCLLKSNMIQNVIKQHARGSTILHAGSAIPHLKFNLPTSNALRYFDSKAIPIYELLQNLSKQNTQLRQARDILLPKLMSDEIDVEGDISKSTIIEMPNYETMAAEDEVPYVVDKTHNQSLNKTTYINT